MKQSNKYICDFITDFQLEDPIKGICFEAEVFFFSQNLNVQAISEIHIITINGKGLDVLYILSTTIGLEDLPTMFVIEGLEVSFNQQDGLKLNGFTAKKDSFLLVVQPTGKNCTKPAQLELNTNASN